MLHLVLPSHTGQHASLHPNLGPCTNCTCPRAFSHGAQGASAVVWYHVASSIMVQALKSAPKIRSHRDVLSVGTSSPSAAPVYLPPEPEGLEKAEAGTAWPVALTASSSPFSWGAIGLSAELCSVVPPRPADDTEFWSGFGTDGIVFCLPASPGTAGEETRSG